VSDLLIWVQLTATLYLTGLIWVIQVVHYPLMNRVPAEAFVEFHDQHSRRISSIVVAPMVIELATVIGLLILRPASVPHKLLALSAILVALLWLSTFALQVPLHRKLATGFDPSVHRALVRGNWIRTVAWTLRAPVALVMAISATG